MVDYSKWDNLELSSDEEDEGGRQMMMGRGGDGGGESSEGAMRAGMGMDELLYRPETVSYTHLTLPTN